MSFSIHKIAINDGCSEQELSSALFDHIHECDELSPRVRNLVSEVGNAAIGIIYTIEETSNYANVSSEYMFAEANVSWEPGHIVETLFHDVACFDQFVNIKGVYLILADGRQIDDCYEGIDVSSMASYYQHHCDAAPSRISFATHGGRDRQVEDVFYTIPSANE